MLYIGNFNYSDENDVSDNYVLMPAVVEASDAEEALDRFEKMFERLNAKSDLLDGAHSIYLDSLVELDRAPESAVLIQWEKIVPADEGLCSITAALPELEEGEVASAYGWNDDDEGLEHTHIHSDSEDAVDTELDNYDDDEDGFEEEPFMRL